MTPGPVPTSIRHPLDRVMFVTLLPSLVEVLGGCVVRSHVCSKLEQNLNGDDIRYEVDLDHCPGMAIQYIQNQAMRAMTKYW